ncbi:hypothetical protein [Leptospira idonii]|uniref:Uncharacterized protein n=1 Tax=Leptospira idonii TaxID=1193500 RepID=A0A4R9M191_9LEPT|nr:hypothetical protein [Leptospira idonii]TGN20514.1 hypothetical protein EHS15_03325 [Leptospira idonii]
MGEIHKVFSFIGLFESNVRKYNSTHFRMDSRYKGINPPDNVYWRRKPIDNEWRLMLYQNLFSFVTFSDNSYNWSSVRVLLWGLTIKSDFLMECDLHP